MTLLKHMTLSGSARVTAKTILPNSSRAWRWVRLEVKKNKIKKAEKSHGHDPSVQNYNTFGIWAGETWG